MKMIRAFVPGDVVLAAGLALDWQAAHVDLSSGLDPSPAGVAMTLVRWGADSAPEQTTVTNDHLFVLADKTLLPAAALVTGDQLLRPDGSSVAVLDVHAVSSSNGVHHISTGPWTGSLDGHLLDYNNIVTTDMAVQVAVVTAGVPAHHLHREWHQRPRVGSPAYTASYGERAQQFRSDPTRWPPGVIVI